MAKATAASSETVVILSTTGVRRRHLEAVMGQKRSDVGSTFLVCAWLIPCVFFAGYSVILVRHHLPKVEGRDDMPMHALIGQLTMARAPGLVFPFPLAPSTSVPCLLLFHLLELEFYQHSSNLEQSIILGLGTSISVTKPSELTPSGSPIPAGASANL